MNEYIEGRDNLAAIAILIDCLRGPEDEELAMADDAALAESM